MTLFFDDNIQYVGRRLRELGRMSNQLLSPWANIPSAVILGSGCQSIYMSNGRSRLTFHLSQVDQISCLSYCFLTLFSLYVDLLIRHPRPPSYLIKLHDGPSYAQQQLELQ